MVASEDLERFRESMKIGFDEWHEGIPYDLEALDALTPDERLVAEDLALSRKARDWRDIQALDHLGSQRCLGEVRKALRSENPEVRAEAVWALRRRESVTEQEVEAAIIDALDHRTTTLSKGLTRVLSLALVYRTPAVRRKLLACVLDGKNADVRVFSAVYIAFMEGASPSLWESPLWPLYRRFGSGRRSERRQAYLELCAEMGRAPELEDLG